MAFDEEADPLAIQSPSPLPGPGTLPVLTFAEDSDGASWANVEQPLKALGGEIAYLKKYGWPLVDVESFRLNPGYSDYTTLQAALDTGKPLWFPKRTYTLANGQTLINRNCHVMVGNETTFKIADNAIVNTDADPYNHTAFLRIQGVQGFAMLGSWIIDGNRDNQGYPATVNVFGRGGAVGSGGSRSNGIIEVTPAEDNATPARHLRFEGLEIKNAYTNGLVCWQTVDTWIRGCYTHDNRINGIAGAGPTDFYVVNCHHYRDGWSDVVNTTRRDGDAAGVQIRELPAALSAASLSMPMIPVVTNDQVNYNVQIIDCSANECGVESWFLRACFPGKFINCTSRNVGYKRLTTASFNCAHFWADMGWWEWINCTALQTVDNSLSGWQRPTVGNFAPFDGNGIGNTISSLVWNVEGTYRSMLRGLNASCGSVENGDKKNYFNKGLIVWERSRLTDVVIEGCSADPITIINGGNFNLQPPTDVHLENVTVTNAAADRAILIRSFTPPGKTLTGRGDNITIEDLNVSDIRSALSGDDDHSLIDVSSSMSTFGMSGFRAVNLNLDGFSAAGNHNGVRFRGDETSEGIEVHFRQCVNVFSACRTNAFRSLVLTGSIVNCYRIFRSDFTGATTDPDLFRMLVNARGITDDLIALIGMGAHKFKSFRVDNCEFHGAAGARTFNVPPGDITKTVDQFFAEALSYSWRNNVEDFGSSNPATLLYDMRRKFTDVAAITAATPYYVGEISVEMADGSIWLGFAKTAGSWVRVT